MEKENSDIFFKSLWVMQENERLSKQAKLLDQENKALLNELEKKYSMIINLESSKPADPNNGSTSTSTSTKP
ncbi:hypothetical protein FRX31_027283 [Thalictrum thalictroides]|uniref:Uncharacterized protein n=1 Tax=Thalictrum thalictroides TaxID=46969 RepID=A0A7J6VEK4_THATH|nr:hypothetical protein FRX31_027283 [Thalictrum thalictroides]